MRAGEEGRRGREGGGRRKGAAMDVESQRFIYIAIIYCILCACDLTDINVYLCDLHRCPRLCVCCCGR
jgi:hypothetical protein